MQPSLLSSLLITGVLVALYNPIMAESNAANEMPTNDICTDCMNVVGDISQTLKNPADEEIIIKKLEQLCRILGSTYCTDLVDEYGELALSYVAQFFDPKTICASLRLCPSQGPVPLADFKLDKLLMAQDNGTFCVDCEAFLTILSNLFKDRTIDEEVTQMIEKVCPLLPESLAEQCKGFLDLYGPVLLKLIADAELDPNDICKDVRLCSSIPNLPARQTLSVGSAACSFCLTLVAVIENVVECLVENGITLLAAICDVLPDPVAGTCRNLVETIASNVAKVILEILRTILTPERICGALRVCSQTPIGQLESKICDQGPTFWCASMDNAKLCNNIEHCRRHAWN
ncbi:prosaposin-like [Acanthaster planci]|uniref:Prosaposin-like n=1 Tax=Acanthaster planci TaxID=133434 RepID=A0A8B7Y6M3_ACAPL|nr:prosaposin-like [Acanthaster planci]